MSPEHSVATDPFARLRRMTPARIGLGQTGDAVPMRAVLDFQASHARARDAVHAVPDFAAIAAAIAPLPSVCVHSLASDRPTYLRRPDLGRQLSATGFAALPEAVFDIVLIAADGLSAKAVDAHAAPLVQAIVARLPQALRIAPIVLARNARVALGDDVGGALGARVAVMLIGERPGLTVADSLGAYLTFAPKRGRTDAERNCISNIHAHGGLTHAQAADKIAWLLTEMLRRRLSGVGLKDDQDGVGLLG